MSHHGRNLELVNKKDLPDANRHQYSLNNAHTSASNADNCSTCVRGKHVCG